MGWRTCAAHPCAFSDPGLTRTGDLRFRKPPLYPPELRGLLEFGVCSTCPSADESSTSGRDTRGRQRFPAGSSLGATGSMKAVWAWVVDPSEDRVQCRRLAAGAVAELCVGGEGNGAAGTNAGSRRPGRRALRSRRFGCAGAGPRRAEARPRIEHGTGWVSAASGGEPAGGGRPAPQTGDARGDRQRGEAAVDVELAQRDPGEGCRHGPEAGRRLPRGTQAVRRRPGRERRKDANERVRAFSTRVLGKFKQVELAETFERLLEDGSPFVRQNAAWALGELGAEVRRAGGGEARPGRAPARARARSGRRRSHGGPRRARQARVIEASKEA